MPRRALIAIALAAAVVAVYAGVADHELLIFDDQRHIVDNPGVTAESTAAAVRSAFLTSLDGSWVPLTTLSLRLDHTLWGLAPQGFLLTNVALHALSAVLLFLTLARMTHRLWPSACVAAVFALHPLHVESVAWASERKDVLSGVFWMLTLWAYARYADRPGALGRYALLLAIFALGLLAKPMLVTLPLVLLLLDFWPLDRLRSRGARALVAEKLPLFGLAALAGVAGLLSQLEIGAVSTDAYVPLVTRVMNAAESYVAYVVASVWPRGLAAYYPHPFYAISPWYAAACTGLLTAVTAAVLRGRAARPYLAVGWLWYVVTLLPVIGIVQVGLQARADRYTYLPQIGLAIAAVWGAAELARRWRLPPRTLAALGGVWIAALGLTARAQVAHWRDSRTVFERALAVTEGNFFAERGLANVLLSEGDREGALAHFEAAIRYEPRWALPHLELADTLVAMRRGADALPHYRAAARLDPALADARERLGIALLAAGADVEAAAELREAQALGVETAALHGALATLAERSGASGRALEHWQAAVLLEPRGIASRRGLAFLLATSSDPAVRDPKAAIDLAETLARRTQHGDPRVLDTLAAGLAAAGRYVRATRTAREAVSLARRNGDETLAAEIRAHALLYSRRRSLGAASSPAPRAPMRRP